MNKKKTSVSVMHHGKETSFNLEALNRTEQIEEAFEKKTIYDLYCFEKYKCTGFVLAETGVMLIGMKVLNTGKVLNLIMPLTDIWESPEYLFSFQFQNDLDKAITEVKAHIKGKGTGGQQLDLFHQPEEAAV